MATAAARAGPTRLAGSVLAQQGRAHQRAVRCRGWSHAGLLAESASKPLRPLADVAYPAGEPAELATGVTDSLTHSSEVDSDFAGEWNTKDLAPTLKRGSAKQDASCDADRASHRRDPEIRYERALVLVVRLIPSRRTPWLA